MSRGFSRLAFAGFSATFRPWMRRRIAAVHLAGLPREIPPAAPLLLAANHPSWWDAFLLWEIRRALRPEAPMHTVMLESELRRHPFLRRIGAIGMDPTAPASVGRAARELERRLHQRPDSVVFFFPQGRIFPSYRRPLGFRRGIELFARRVPTSIVLPVALHLEPLATPAPHAFVAAGAPLPAMDSPSSARVEAAVEAELDAILALLARHGEEAPAHWPGPAGTVPRAPLVPAVVEGGWVP